MKRKVTAVLMTLGLLLTGTACTSAADTANQNLSEAAENFEVPRRIIGVNTIRGDVLFEVTGFCSYETDAEKIEAICLVDRASGEIERTTLGKADNVTFVSTQTGPVGVDFFRPRVIFRPETIVANFDLSTSNNPTEPK